MAKTVEHAFRLHDQDPVCKAIYWRSGWTVPRYWDKITCRRCKAKRKSKGSRP